MMRKISVFAILLLLATSSVSLDSVVSSSSSSITVGLAYAPPSTFFQNPTAASFGNTIIDTPYIPVSHMSINGSMLPGICKVPTPAPGVTNGTQWVVNLISPNLKWSDGVPINSTDLAYSFGMFLKTGPYANTSTIDRWGAVSGTVESVTIVNSTAINVKTFKTDAKFPILTFLYSVYPYHYYKQFGFGTNALQSTAVLAGPGDSAYVPVNYTPGSYTMTLQANPNSPSWNGKTPTITTLTIQFFTSDSAQTNALAAGTIDAATISPSDIAALQSVSNLKIAQVPSGFELQVYMRYWGYPWNVTAFRQALMYLIPSNEVKSSLYNNQTATGNPEMLLPQVAPTYYAPNAPLYNYSVSQAETLLAQAGLVKNSQGKWQFSNGTALTVTVEAPNNDPNYVRASQFVQTSLQAAGINVNLNNPAYATAHTDWTSLTFQLMLFPNNYAPVPFRWMRNPNNLNGWPKVNSTFSNTFNQALSNPNEAQSLTQIKQAELIMAQAAVINYVVILPEYVAYNDVAFSNWQPALGQSAYDDVFCNYIVCENVLTSVAAAGVATTSSTTSSATSSTSSTTAPTGTNYTLYYAAAAVVVIVVVILAVALSRRKPGPAPKPST